MEMEWNFIVRLCVAGLCGTIIGLDREYRGKVSALISWWRWAAR